MRLLFLVVVSFAVAWFLCASSFLYAQQSSSVVDEFTVQGNLHLRDFNLLGGGILEYPGKLWFKRGGDGHGLPPTNGYIRAQPGGNLELLPQGDYFRSALDIYPTMGKKPEMDALAELTLHRIHPSNEAHEMMSITALAESQSRFGIIVEAHGHGRVKPLDLQMIQGGLLEADKDVQPFNAIAMRVKTDGTAQFSAQRNGGPPGPVDAISIERNIRRNSGDQPSDYVRWTAKRTDQQTQNSDWRANVQIPNTTGSELAIESRAGTKPYEKKMKVHSTGDVELPVPAAGIVLTSPNGKKWRLGVTDTGDLRVFPSEGK